MPSSRYRFFIRCLHVPACLELWGNNVSARSGDWRLVVQSGVVTPLAVSEVVKVA